MELKEKLRKEGLGYSALKLMAADRIEHLEQQLEKVKEVLRFYANKENYYVTVINGRVRKPKIDEGKKARDFLGEDK